MKKLVLMLLLLLGCGTLAAQDVVRNGNTFEQVSKKKKSVEPVKTKYTFKTLDGKVYPIYISAKGKCFIKRISKDGKEYPYYNLPKELKDLIYKEYTDEQVIRRQRNNT